ncbi:MAG TPA: hypothetical protein PLL10_00480, partial [Elusimicrobiales bacterium]|nr:hypothetical protein [Elusimicrobiales bacterium]
PGNPIAHAFIIVGYRVVGGEIQFLTRNSYPDSLGNQVNPPVLESQLCRVSALTTVLTPKEKL